MKRVDVIWGFTMVLAFRGGYNARIDDI